MRRRSCCRASTGSSRWSTASAATTPPRARGARPSTTWWPPPRVAGPRACSSSTKGLSVTLHYREHPEAADAVRAWAEGQAARSGLELRTAKMSIELHPPVATDKGAVVMGLAEGLDNVCFLGDDVGDLPAFAALDRLRDEGRTRREGRGALRRAGSGDGRGGRPHGRRPGRGARPRAGPRRPRSRAEAPGPASVQSAAASWSASQSSGVRAAARRRSSPASMARSSGVAVRAATRASAVPLMS